MTQDTDWGAILNQILSLAPAVAGGIQAFGGGTSGALGQARQEANMADPFASQRQLYQGQLAQTLGQPGGAPNPYASQIQALLTDPNSFKTDPGYQFALGQGQQAINRGSNALYGTGRTGSLGPELAKYTEGYANQAFDTRLNQLTALSGQQQTYNTNLMKELLTASGADQGNPYGAAQLMGGGYVGQNRGTLGLLQGLGGSQFGGVGGGVGGLLNSILGKGGGGSIDYGNYGTGPGALQLGGPGGEMSYTPDIVGNGAPDWSNMFDAGNWSYD